jgi:hypothetical protein
MSTRIGFNQVIDGTLVPAGWQRITSLPSAATLTVPASAKIALIQCETQNVRFRDDGTDPEAGVGMLMVAGNPPFLYTGDLSALRFIETAASASLNVLYYQ